MYKSIDLPSNGQKVVAHVHQDEEKAPGQVERGHPGVVLQNEVQQLRHPLDQRGVKGQQQLNQMG